MMEMINFTLKQPAVFCVVKVGDSVFERSGGECGSARGVFFEDVGLGNRPTFDKVWAFCLSNVQEHQVS